MAHSNSKPKKIKQQLHAATDAAKRKLDQTLDRTQETLKDKLAEADRWAIDLVNEAVDTTSEQLERVTAAAKEKLEKTVEKTQAKAKRRLSKIGAKLQAAWQKIAEDL